MRTIVKYLSSTICFAMLLFVFATSSNAGWRDEYGYTVETGTVYFAYLLESCAVPGKTAKGLIPNFDCQSYVLGVLDTYRNIINKLPDKGKLCVPNNVDAGTILDKIENRYKVHSFPENALAADLIIETLFKEYKCDESY